jgi:hypothetical protein
MHGFSPTPSKAKFCFASKDFVGKVRQHVYIHIYPHLHYVISGVMLQGPLLANYSQSFIEQLRAASSPYAYSTGGAKRRLSFSHESRLQRLIMWLSLTFKRGIPLGAAAAQRRQKSAVSCCLSAGTSPLYLQP